MKEKIKLIFYILKGGNEEMAKLFATLIVYGRTDFKDVPEMLKQRVKQVLIDIDCDHLIVE